MYKVFISDRPLIIRSRQNATVELRDGHLHFHAGTSAELEHILQLLQNDVNIRAVHVYNENPDALYQALAGMCTIVKAAGGIVLNPKGEVLFIHRRGSWDLPKGKMDHGETPEQTAVREVAEECGIPQPVLSKKLKTTWHVYKESGDRILKPTEWFLMHSDYEGELTPQADEGIDDVRWVQRKHWRELAKHSYPNIADLIDHLIPVLDED